MFAKGGLNLPKWHSNISLPEKSTLIPMMSLIIPTSCFQMIQVMQKVLGPGWCSGISFQMITSNTKILGPGWSKASDTLFVMIPTYQPKAITKQYIPSYVASIYNTVRIISASHFIGKVIYRQLQDGKVPWYTKVFVGLQKKIEKWVIETNSVKSEAPRSRVLAEESTRFTCVCWCQYCS